MATGGPYQNKYGEQPDLAPLTIPALRSTTGYTDAQISQQVADQGQNYQPQNYSGLQSDSAPNIQQIAQGQAQASSPAETPAPTQQRAARGGLSFQNPEFGGNIPGSEFYLGQERPAEYRASGGDPFSVHSFGRIPLGVLADRAAQLHQSKKELADWFSKQNEQFQGKAAPPYELAYQNYVDKEHDGLIQSWADQHFAGNRSKALKDLYENADSNRLWNALNRDLRAIGDANAYQFKDYADTLDKVNTNQMAVSPETKDRLVRFQSGSLPFDDKATPGERAYDIRVLDQGLSRDKFWTSVATPTIEAKMKEMLKTPGDVVKRDGRLFLTERAHKDLSELKDQLVAHMTHSVGMGTEKQIRDFVEANTPKYDVTDMHALPIGPQRSSAQQGLRTTGSGFSNGNVNFTKSEVTPTAQTALTPLENTSMTSYGLADPTRYTISKTNKDGEVVDLKPQNFREKAGSNKFMVPKEIIKVKDQFYIQGPEVDNVAISKSDVKTKEGGDEETITSEDGNTYRVKQYIQVPVNQNADWAKNYGLDLNSMWPSNEVSTKPADAGKVTPDADKQLSAADEWQAMREANPSLSGDEITKRVKKKLGL